MKKNSLQNKKQLTISQKFIQQLYNMEVEFKDEKGNDLQVTKSGFLGLLAVGYKGLIMHRKRTGQTYLYNNFTKGKKLVKRKKQNTPNKI